MLDLQQLREKSVQRAKEGFKTYDNVPITYWTTAIAGELGELCNMIKKMERVKNGGIDAGSSYTAVDITREMLKEEFGGIAIYLDLLASFFGISLEEAIMETFNSKSEKYGFAQKLSYIENQQQEEMLKEAFNILLKHGDIYTYDYDAAIKELEEKGFTRKQPKQ